MKADLIYTEPESAYKTRITFSVNTHDLKEIPKECELSIKKYHPNRNTDQNAKYWSNLRDLASALDTSIIEAHNIILHRYGVLEKDAEGKPVKMVMKETFDWVKSEDLHLFPTKYTVDIDGVKYRLFYKIKNSSQYNSQEFSKLLDGLLSELKEME